MSGRRVIVVGGGPAGSLAGLLLVRQGLDVQLLEQHRFPRDKVCGECLSAVGLDVLERAGLIDGLESAQPAVFGRATVHLASGPPIELRLPRPMWGLTRATLDQRLLDAAIAEGVVAHQPVRCERVIGGSRPTATWRDLRTNQITVADADWIVVADGKSALLGGVPPPTTDIGIKAHFVDVDGPRDAIELFAGPGCYGGLAAVEGDRWNAAFSVPAATVRGTGGDISKIFASVTLYNSGLSRRLKVAKRVGDWLAAPLPRFPVRPVWPEGIVPIGNAAAALEPIGGEGMGLALRSAELAVTTIVERRQASPLIRSYRRLWTSRQHACRLAAKIVSNPGASRLIDLANRDDAHVNRLALTLIGKGST